MSADRDEIVAAYDDLDKAQARVAALTYETLTNPEVLALVDRREIARRRDHTIDHALLARLNTAAKPTEFGASSMPEVLSRRLRISRSDARRRLDDADQLGPRRALTGESLAPRLSATAAALAKGAIGPEHVRTIQRFFRRLPGWVDATTREQAEQTLARIAADLTPEELRAAADRLMQLIDQDGDPPDEAERAARRHLTIGRQQTNGMSEIKGLLDPEARAALDAVLAKWAAPGRCNPDGESPDVDNEPDHESVERDTRSQGQRNHDALKAMARSTLASGQLGQHNGLPATIVVTTTLAELQSGAGLATSGGGTLLPMRDVIRLASHAYHYLVVYQDHTEIPLYLGRAKRLASPGQRIVLYARDRGCTRPGCTAPAYWCQAHHSDADFRDGGQTNIDELTLACPADHQLLTEHGWKTRRRKDGRTEWIPPPHLDTGQARVNGFHHPQRYLTDPDDDESG